MPFDLNVRQELIVEIAGLIQGGVGGHALEDRALSLIKMNEDRVECALREGCAAILRDARSSIRDAARRAPAPVYSETTAAAAPLVFRDNGAVLQRGEVNVGTIERMSVIVRDPFDWPLPGVPGITARAATIEDWRASSRYSAGQERGHSRSKRFALEIVNLLHGNKKAKTLPDVMTAEHFRRRLNRYDLEA